ncbi:MAG: hypothetical protein JWO09_3887 [Bacteroidetes bacterium]|nr:hypothetical protein [Bacteroidota bacterium]
MNDKTFMTISPEKCLVVYKQVIAKSQRQFEEAEVLAARGGYDTASSLLIISNEELLKALILFMEGNGFHLRKIKGFKTLFNNHKLRYLIALVLSVLSLLGKEFARGMALFMKVDEDFLSKIDPKSPGFADLAKNYFIARLLEVKAEIEFFSKVDKARQQGFYSEYNDGLITISKEEYLLLHTKIVGVNMIVHSFIEGTITDENFRLVHLPPIQKGLIEKTAIEQAEKFFAKLNSPGFNSYESMLTLIEEMHQNMLSGIPFNEILSDKKQIKKLSSGIKKIKNMHKKNTEAKKKATVKKKLMTKKKTVTKKKPLTKAKRGVKKKK